ncbi:MAG: hypothetical protein NT062_23810 [Proteobacteria bacterium]|nr:hypothetical protein [Pseudomonadota bacterium]
MNQRNSVKVWYVGACLLAAACSTHPAPTGTTCDPDPLTLAYSTAAVPACTPGDDTGDCGFGKRFMDHYCTSCHLSTLARAQRHGAPLYHDFDTLLGVLKTPDHIDEQAGVGPDAANHFMPPDRCPSVPGGALDKACDKPTDAEREQLAQWIACERNRDHTF